MRKSLCKATWLAVGIFLICVLRAGQAEAGSVQTSGKSASGGSSILSPHLVRCSDNTTVLVAWPRRGRSLAGYLGFT